jgi:hypothetical protein
MVHQLCVNRTAKNNRTKLALQFPSRYTLYGADWFQLVQTISMRQIKRDWLIRLKPVKCFGQVSSERLVWKVCIARQRYRPHNFDGFYVFAIKISKSPARNFQTFQSG